MPPVLSSSIFNPKTNVVSNEYVLYVAFASFFGFLIVQAVFALIAHSQAMLADCEAMLVDAMTYLLNLLAERIKNRPWTPSELVLLNHSVDHENDHAAAAAIARVHRRRELQRLYLELIPPALSVLTLSVITCMTLREAVHTLLQRQHNGHYATDTNHHDGDINEEEEEDDDDVSLTIMLIFSGINLLVDIVNVTCFSRAQMQFGLGLQVVRGEQRTIQEAWRKRGRGLDESFCRSDDSDSNDSSSSDRDHSAAGIIEQDEYENKENDTADGTDTTGAATEETALLKLSTSTNLNINHNTASTMEDPRTKRTTNRRVSSSEYYPVKSHVTVNLNMCSAWTHVFADTLRSIAVLLAAGVATLAPSQFGITPESADATAAIVVSFIIFISLLPLLQGLVVTALTIISLTRRQQQHHHQQQRTRTPFSSSTTTTSSILPPPHPTPV